jgi:hypothetical protein
MLAESGSSLLVLTKLQDQPIKKLELVGGDEMKKRKRVGIKNRRRSKEAKTTVPSPAVAKVDSGSSLSELDFKPIEIRGEPLSITVLRNRR